MNRPRSRPRPRKIAIRVLVLVFLGALVNMAVACLFAMLAPMEGNAPLRAVTASDWAQQWWSAHAPAGAASSIIAADPQRGFGASALTLYADRTGQSAVVPGGFWGPMLDSRMGAVLDRAIIVQAGLPLPVFEGARWDVAIDSHWQPASVGMSASGPMAPAHRHDGAVSVKRMGLLGMHPQFRLLPLRPMWMGLGFNTAFYAALVWGMVAMLGGLSRKRRRLKRGLCVKCAYDLRGRGAAHAVCPECGTSTQHRKPTAESELITAPSRSRP